MEYDDVLTRNDDGELSVRTVSSSGDSGVDPNDVYTRDGDGKLCVRVTGSGGGSDAHNKGWFADIDALSTAYPTGEDGDYAILGSTDTVWVWDSDESEWVDTDRKGQVESVNGETGAVNIKSINNNSLMGSGDLELSTYLTYPSGWTTTGTTKAFCDLIAADTSAVKGKAYLGEVTLSDLPASLANGEVVVEIMSGTTAANKIIVLTLTSGNTNPYLWKYTYWNNGTDVSGWIGFLPTTGGEITGDLSIHNNPQGNSITIGQYGSNRVFRLYAKSSAVNDIFIDVGTASIYPRSDGNGSIGKANLEFGTVYTKKLNNGADLNLPTSGGTLASLSLPSTMPTLAVADWSNNEQTITVTGVTASNVVIVSPAPASAADYAAAGIVCTAQGTDSLTFSCDTTPTNAITVNVIILS